MQPLLVHLLQPPLVKWGETPIQFNRRAIRNLFFYLACQPQSDRTRLFTLFWPDLPEGKSRPLLRTTLSKLRKSLPDPNLVLTNGETVQLDPSRVWVDVQEFRDRARQNLRAALQIPNQQSLPEALAQPLHRAINLWSANEFWPGMDFHDQPELEEWARDLRLEVSYDFQRILERMAYHAAAGGDLEVALTRARRALQLDPLNDDMHANVFRWLLDSGQRSKALEYCQVVRDTYRRQETALPGHLEKLCEATRAIGSLLKAEPVNLWLRSTPTTPPYIHRPEIEQFLLQSFQRGERLTVTGEAGAGKTRLMAEVFRTLDPSPRLLLMGSHPSEQNLPFQALINALRHQVLQEEWLKLDRVWVSHLARLLPELAVLRPDAATPPSQFEGESPLYEALRQLLVSIAQTNRLLLVLDNAHTCDQASMDAVTYLCNHSFFGQYGLLVVAYRLEEETPAFRQFLAASSLEKPGNCLKVPPFNADEISLLTQRILGQTPTPETIRRLIEETGGNPLFLIESLYLVLKDPSLDVNQMGGSLPLSANLHALVHDRLQHLSPTAYQVASVAAVIGEAFAPELIEKAGNLRSELVVQAFEELELARLIHLAPEPVQKQFSFVYSKIREVLLLEMGLARQRMLHLRIAHAIESSHDLMPGLLEARLAEHYEGAGETRTAFAHWINAGVHALNLLSPAEAQSAFENAQRLLAQIDQTVPDASIYRLYKEWNRAVNAAGNPVRMREINFRLLETGEKRLSPLLCGTALTGLARAALFQNQTHQSLQYCERAAIYLAQVDEPFETTRMNNIRGDCLVLMDRYDDAIEDFTRVITLSDEMDPHLLDARAHAEYSLSEAYLAKGWPSLARDMDLRCLQTCLKSKNANWAMKAHMMAALSEYYLGNMDEGLDHARQGITLAESLESWRNLAYILITQARIELALGWIDDSWQHIQRAEELGVQHALPRVLSWTASHRGQILRFLRQYELATREYRSGLEHSVFALDRLECQFRLGLSLAGEGKIEESQQTLLACLEKSESAGIVLMSLLAETSLLLVQVKNWQIDEVRQRLPGFLERAKGHQIAEVDIGVESIQAMLAQREGRHEEGKVLAYRAREHSEQTGILWWELVIWQVLTVLGEEKGIIQKRVDQLLGTLRDRGQKTPELACHLQAFIAWTNNEVGYT